MSDASKIETNGVNPVPDNERYGRPFDLFPVWFSWNISIFGITLGIYVFGLGLSVWQAMLAGVIGYFLSCALVGILAVGSVRTGLPTLVQSRLAFGYHGNKLPTFFGYLANMGWKVTLLSMATTTLADLVANLVPGLLNDKGMPVAGCTLGCFAVVLEKIPAALAARVTAEIPTPTIGIGAGAGCDGQVLVIHDMLGINKGFSPRFLRRYADLHTVMTGAVEQYVRDVKECDFPNEKEQY